MFDPEMVVAARLVRYSHYNMPSFELDDPLISDYLETLTDAQNKVTGNLVALCDLLLQALNARQKEKMREMVNQIAEGDFS